MDYTVGYLLALAVVAAGFIGVILALIVLEVSRWKFAVSLILSLILVGLGGYYYFVVGQSEKGVPDANKLNALMQFTSSAPAVVVPEAVEAKTPVVNVKEKEAVPAPAR